MLPWLSCLISMQFGVVQSITIADGQVCQDYDHLLFDVCYVMAGRIQSLLE